MLDRRGQQQALRTWQARTTLPGERDTTKRLGHLDIVETMDEFEAHFRTHLAGTAR